MSTRSQRSRDQRRDEPSPTSTPPRDRAELLEWAIRYAVPLSGLVAAVIYGVLRLSYALFYQPLRATPEEVGYDYVEILAGQLIGALEITVVVWAVLFALSVTWSAGRSRLAAAARGPRRPPSSRGGRHRWRTPAVRCALVALGLVAVLLPVAARELGVVAARDGRAMRNIHLAGSNVPVLPVTALAASVTALTPDTESLERMDCLLYLGVADGVAVFFDVATKDGIRVPTAAVLISLHNADHVASHCVER